VWPARGLGFSLLEVLVTLLLISLALLGTLGLQAYALKLNQSGHFRTQAVLLASDLAERMEANRAAAVAGRYAYVCPAAAAPSSTDCGPTGPACAAAALAEQDLLQWQAAVAASLPQGSCAVVQGRDGNPGSYTISIGWLDRQTDTGYDASVLGPSGRGEAQSYQANRILFD
jgi:type IV pilus assembly protein PilV